MGQRDHVNLPHYNTAQRDRSWSELSGVFPKAPIFLLSPFSSSSSAAVGGCDFWSLGIFSEESRGVLGEMWEVGIWGGEGKQNSCRTRREAHTISPSLPPPSLQGRKNCVFWRWRTGGGFSWQVQSDTVNWGPWANFLVYDASLPSLLLMSSLFCSWVFLFRECFFSLIKASFLFPKLYLGGPSGDICLWLFCTTA